MGRVDLEEFQQANGSVNTQIKGSDGARKLGFYSEAIRSYYDENDGVATGQRHPLLRSMKRPYTTAGRGLSAIRGEDAVPPCPVRPGERSTDV